MQSQTLHTPYDGSSAPFTIGLAQLDEAQWLEVDAQWAAYVAEKKRLYAEIPDKVMVAEEGTEAAQDEVLATLKGNLAQYHPQIDLHTDGSLPPLARAALLVQEDLVLMRKSEQGWRLVAASLCFPSSWRLLDKFRKPLGEIHRPVPGFQSGTRNAGLIERMFDNLSPARLVIRWNWSLQEDLTLYHPSATHRSDAPRFGAGDLTGRVILRLERQTLRKLPQSGDILFTIRIHLNPIEMLASRPDRAELAASLESQLAGLTADEANYKGISAERTRLAARLQEIATGTSRP